jgi:hypothetical protein
VARPYGPRSVLAPALVDPEIDAGPAAAPVISRHRRYRHFSRPADLRRVP